MQIHRCFIGLRARLLGAKGTRYNFLAIGYLGRPYMVIFALCYWATLYNNIYLINKNIYLINIRSSVEIRHVNTVTTNSAFIQYSVLSGSAEGCTKKQSSKSVVGTIPLLKSSYLSIPFL